MSGMTNSTALSLSPGFIDLRGRLEAGETLYGSFATLGSPVATEDPARVGFDWLMIDLEHGVTAESGADLPPPRAVGTTTRPPSSALSPPNGSASGVPWTWARTG